MDTVRKMFKLGVKEESSSKLSRLTGKMMSALGIIWSLQAFLLPQGRAHNKTLYKHTYSSTHIEIKCAVLNVERKKSEALMKRRKHLQIY
jgi:hypothetical protein